MAKTPTWQRAEGKNPEGGLNEKGRASLRAAGHDIKRPQPGEATLKPYDPTIKERIYQGIAGTEERPSPERAQFARGMSQMAEFAPVLGNVMAGQEAQRRGDTKGMLMAALPVPGMATEARMAEAAMSPAQEAAREAYQRVLNAQGLYSHAAEAAANLPQAKGSYEQMMAMLQKAGVKPEEMRWSGVEQFAGQPVTREQLVSHFEQNVPKIEETVLGGPRDENLSKSFSVVPVGHGEFEVVNEAGVGITRYGSREMAEETAQRFNTQGLPSHLSGRGQIINEPKFQQYTIPGGENYREVLLHTPSQKQDLYKQISQAREDRIAAVKEHGSVLKYDDPALEQERLQKIREATKRENDLRAQLENIAPEYTSSHWDQPNVLGHLRMSDRTSPEGEKILHLEELQSDWGQAGRKQGFKGEKIKGYQVNWDGRPLSTYETPEEAKAHIERALRNDPSAPVSMSEVMGQRPSGHPEEMNRVPSAPYVESTKNWVDLGLKRALKEAAEGGYSKMVWTPGEQQAARYDIGKQVSHIQYNPETGMLVAADKRGTPVVKQEVHRDRLPEFIGKEAAEKLLKNKMEGLPLYELKGDDLQFGGQGMKSFYDKMVPTRLKELLKKIDPQAKMSMTEINGEDGPIKVPTVEITPKIREAVKKGLPLYAKGGEVVNNADPYDNIQMKAKNFPRARRASN